MGLGAFIEPAIVITLLFGGAWINRAPSSSHALRHPRWAGPAYEERSAVDTEDDEDAQAFSTSVRPTSPSLSKLSDQPWRQRELHLMGKTRIIQTPNTAIFRNRLLSRVLKKFPFLVEAWYWALIYWVYQLGRAFTALTIQKGTRHVARKHALELIELEKRLHIFWELPIQHFFLQFPALMRYINWLYSFIHIPGTIAFLVWLYYYTITSNRVNTAPGGGPQGSPSGPWLYEARRRTMAICNLMAFVVFTLWPCMPPRLLSDPDVKSEMGDLARSFGFVDTVHGTDGAVSVWTANKVRQSGHLATFLTVM